MGTIVPPHVYIELTNLCNFKCKFCPYPFMEREKGIMDLGVARSILDNLEGSSVEWIYMAGMGEPLLYPYLVPFIEEANDRGFSTHLFTNGYLLKEAITPKIYNAGLSVLGISLHASTSRSFERLHLNQVSFDTYLSRIKWAIKNKFEVGNSVEIRLYLMCTSTSKLFGYPFEGAINNKEEAFSEIMKWVQFGRALSRESHLRFQPNTPCKEDLNPSLFKIQILPDVWVVSKLLLPWGVDYRRKIPALIGACRGLQDEFGILYNGDVTMCCMDFEGATKIGKIQEESLKVIFNKSYTKKARSLLRLGIPPTGFCRKCRGGTNFRMWLATQLGSLVHHKLHIPIGGW